MRSRIKLTSLCEDAARTLRAADAMRLNRRELEYCLDALRASRGNATWALQTGTKDQKRRLAESLRPYEVVCHLHNVARLNLTRQTPKVRLAAEVLWAAERMWALQQLLEESAC